MVDPSHTFVERSAEKKRKTYMVYNYKPTGKEKDSKTLHHERRVTHDYNGSVVLRLVETRDIIGEKDKPNPLDKYWQ